jgi:5-formyltetrahydrofolate cyclo-ligase
VPVDDVSASKEALRTELSRARGALDPAYVRAASRAVCKLVAALPAFARVRRIALYSAMVGEIDPAELGEAVRARGGVTAYPRVDRTSPPTITFHRAGAGDLTVGKFGIAEPAADSPRLGLAEVELAIVPGLAFDDGGHRLGFGRGYYDAALASAPAILRIGVCHELQRIPTVPRSSHDEPVDILVTPAGARATGARPHVLVEVST